MHPNLAHTPILPPGPPPVWASGWPAPAFPTLPPAISGTPTELGPEPTCPDFPDVSAPHLPPGLMVRVHRNLHRACWTLQDAKRVIAHVPCLTLTDCVMVVQPGGQARARAKRQRNVHAYVKGRVAEPLGTPPAVRVRYNVFRDDTFMCEQGQVLTATSAVFDALGHLWISVPDETSPRQAVP